MDGQNSTSFRTILAQEKQEWDSFRNALDKSEKKAFDEIWGIPRPYIMACSNAVSLVPFHPVAMSILFYHYKEMMEYRKQVEQLMDNDTDNNNRINRDSTQRTS
jgi:hypothetical protein